MMDRRLGGTTLALVLLACGIAAPAGAATREFASSFEPSDTPPTWVDTAERASGVTGRTRPGIPGNIMDKVVDVRASGENADGGEVKENLVDGDARHQVAGVRADRLGRARARRAGRGRPLRADLRQRRPRARPAGLDAAGLARRRSLDDARHAARARPSASGSRPRSYDFANTTAYRALPARHHRATPAASIVQLAELAAVQRRTDPAARADMRSLVGERPAQRATPPRPAPASPA